MNESVIFYLCILYIFDILSLHRHCIFIFFAPSYTTYRNIALELFCIILNNS